MFIVGKSKPPRKKKYFSFLHCYFLSVVLLCYNIILVKTKYLPVVLVVPDQFVAVEQLLLMTVVETAVAVVAAPAVTWKKLQLLFELVAAARVPLMTAGMVCGQKQLAVRAGCQFQSDAIADWLLDFAEMTGDDL